MERLTKKDKYGHFYTNQANCRNIWSSDGKKLEGEYFENKTLVIDGKAIDKLGQFEDIEEELEILEILKKQITVIKSKSATDFGNYITFYGLDITVDGLNFIQFDKIRKWLKQ